MQRVLMIVQNDFVNDTRIIKEASTLGKNGFVVKILALHNDGLELKERYKYFSVERIHLKTRKKLSNTNVYIQIIKYVEFYMKCISKGVEFKPDFIHCHDLSTLPIGYGIKKRLKQSKMLYDSHELWSEVFSNKSFSQIILKVQNYIEKTIIKKVEATITVSDSIANHLQNKYKLANRPEVIRNIPFKVDNLKKQNIFRKEYGIPIETKIILYQGMLDPLRGIDKIIDALPYLDNNIVLVMLGNGSALNSFKTKVKSMNLVKRVYFHKAVDSAVLINYTNSANVGISIIENSCLNHFYSLPNKLFEYIQGEIPVICCNFPDMARVIDTYKVGVTVDPTDVGIANGIKEVLADEDTYINNCKQAKELLNWENEEKKLLKIYQELI